LVDFSRESQPNTLFRLTPDNLLEQLLVDVLGPAGEDIIRMNNETDESMSSGDLIHLLLP
jgi:hypothetical protein